ncbi:two-component regulator propeller domain-containing protein [uncultured Polaribacter sp.]|uniref:type IX secretion system anionic LPS delivery protein PorZ n=1 Tax=uncultured Polaribacter sp. TaxID=174711 RepID=UPI0026302D1A|nr:two-component regulator propeller domain-containing protein [uncultured Polaribacter sp.]
MKKLFSIYVFLFCFGAFSQVDFSDSWEDFYSYNNVKDFVKVEDVIYALADNAVFTYNTQDGSLEKLSSVQGLSGETTTALYFNTTFNRLVIGYENGLIEVVDENGEITISSDIVNFNQSGEKSINHISEFNNKLYLATPFAIVVYDIEKLEFGDTYFIGNNSSSIKINQTIIANNTIYAATESGLFKADVLSNLLIDFNNWEQLFFGRNFTGFANLGNLYVTENSRLFSFDGANLNEVRNFSEEIKGIKSSENNINITLNKRAIILDDNTNQIGQYTATAAFDYTLNNAFFEDNLVFLATKEFGILAATLSAPNNYLEIHPEGPLSNEIFSIAVNNKDLWVVYGGYSATFTPLLRRQGFSHFNGENWINTISTPETPLTDLNAITIDVNAENKVYISSAGDTRNINSLETGGLLVVEDDEIVEFYNQNNSDLEDIVVNIPNRVTVRTSGSAIDSQGNLWVTNIGVPNELKKLATNGNWSGIDMSSVKTDPSFGLTEMAIDRNNTIWYGSRNNGVFIFNENGNQKKSFITTPNLGNLPDASVNSVAVDNSNRIWIGTKTGLVVYNNAAGVFQETVSNANPIIILDDGVARRLGGDQNIRSIFVDGADNKWIGTDNGGVLYTNPSGQTTIANFSKQNSPLPSNRILKISADNATGKVFFATDKGIVAYNSNVAPFGVVLGEVYAYPNPALKNHETVTITGRNNTTLPKGTNVKIIDVAGNLVHETNVVEGQELQGGKVVWNKTNLAGTKVASGIYIVLLSNDDASETAITKIAIVN